jgi:HD-GYP domain-containing protein (c-di-GMP phosphodiesterase class II)
MEARDPYTRGHCLRVRYITRGLLARLEVAPEARNAIEIAAFLHDVGKVGVSDLLLQKEGRLTAEERKRLMLHVDLGVELLSAVPDLSDACLLVKHHHEKFDGSGYPDGLRGDAIPFGSRVIAVADAIDAMRTKRPYRAALPLETVIEELRRSSGTQLDPRIVGAGIALLRAQVPRAARRRASTEEPASELREETGMLV